jgi:tetratricopeptide (TPR) repeat protein
MKSSTVSLRPYGAAAALLALLLAPTTLLAETKTGELTITTSSKPALALFQQAREKMENLETAAAAPMLDEAIRKDPDFAMAYAYRALAGGGFNVLRENLEKAVSLKDKMSPGERHWILAQEAGFDGNLTKAKEHGDALLKLYPQDKRVAQLAGTFLGDSPADLGAALRHYEKATALDPRFASAYRLRPVPARRLPSGRSGVQAVHRASPRLPKPLRLVRRAPHEDGPLRRLHRGVPEGAGEGSPVQQRAGRDRPQ